MFKNKMDRAFLIGMFIGMLSAVPATLAEKSYQDYPEWLMLPKGIDLEDEEEVRAAQQLIGRGESVHEAMLAVVRECDDPFIVSSALAVLRQSGGDKSEAVGQLKDLFAQRLSGAGDTRLEEIRLITMAEALADMGQEDDLEALIPLLSSSRRLRDLGIMLLGGHGGLDTLKALETARNRAPDELERRGIEEVIAAIESRLAAQDAPQNAAPSP